MTKIIQKKSHLIMMAQLTCILACLILVNFPASAFIAAGFTVEMSHQSKREAALIGIWFFSCTCLVTSHLLLMWIYIRAANRKLTQTLTIILSLQITFISFVLARATYIQMWQEHLGVRPDKPALPIKADYPIIYEIFFLSVIAITTLLFVLRKKLISCNRTINCLLICTYITSIIIMHVISSAISE
jgi:hypothetical protein